MYIYVGNKLKNEKQQKSENSEKKKKRHTRNGNSIAKVEHRTSPYIGVNMMITRGSSAEKVKARKTDWILMYWHTNVRVSVGTSVCFDMNAYTTKMAGIKYSVCEYAPHTRTHTNKYSSAMKRHIYIHKLTNGHTYTRVRTSIIGFSF